MRYLCNIGDSLLTSGICTWRVVLLWCVGGASALITQALMGVAQGDAGPKAGG